MDVTITGEQLVAVLAFIGGLGTAYAVAVRPLLKMARDMREFKGDWSGAPARPGVAAVPGVMERLGAVEHELRTNNGGSLRDAVNRLEVQSRATAGHVGAPVVAVAAAPLQPYLPTLYDATVQTALPMQAQNAA